MAKYNSNFINDLSLLFALFSPTPFLFFDDRAQRTLLPSRHTPPLIIMRGEVGNRTRAVVCCCSCALPLHATSTKHRRTQSTANNKHTKLFSTAAYSDRQRVRAYKCMCNKIKSASKIFMNESNLLRPFPLLPTVSSPPASSDRTPCSFSFNGVVYFACSA